MVTAGETERSTRSGALRAPPLTHRNKKGELYLRTDEVEEQISAALSLAPGELLERAANLEHASDGYLGPECLVFLIRKFAGARDQEMVQALSRWLLKRCSLRIKKGLDRLENPEARDEAKAQVLAHLFGNILDLESDAGDFLQVRFWVVLNSLTKKALKRAFDAEKRANSMLRLSKVAGEDADDGDEDAPVSRGKSEAALDPSQWPDRKALLSDAERALASMNPKHAEVFRMRYIYDIPIEDKDPEVYTISSHFGNNPRTIRYWLEAAESALQRWRERNHD